MHRTLDRMPELKERIADNALEQKQLHDVTALAAELKRLLVHHYASLKEAGIRKEMQQLENWLEAERKGPAPAGIISESGISWLTSLRDRLKLSAEEAQRLESEGGQPRSREQIEKTENLLNAVQRIDKIINESLAKPH